MHTPAPTSFVQRPAVIVALVYVVLTAVWGIWTVVTYRFPELGGDEPARMLSRTQLVLATSVHAVLFAALALDGWLARRSGPGLRRGHLVGVALCMVVIGLLQWGAVLAHRPIAAG